MKIQRSKPHIIFANLPEGVMLIMSDGRDCGDASADLGRSKKKKRKRGFLPCKEPNRL